MSTSTTSSSPAFAPIAGSDRIDTLDILRGFALFAILLVNWTVDSPGPRGLAGAEDWMAYWPIQFFLQEKGWPVFAFLFGLGFAIQMQRAEARGGRFVPVYVTRLVVLFVLGAVHFVLGERDILHRYAICGLLLLPMRKLRINALPILAIVCILIAWTNRSHLYFRPANSQTIDERAEVRARETLTRQRLAERNRLQASGTFPEVVGVQARILQAELSSRDTYINWLGDPFAPFLLGLYAGRKRIFHEIAAHRQFLRTALCWTLAAGLTGNTVFWSLEFVYDVGGGITGRAEQLVRLLERLTAPALGLAYVAALTLLLEKKDWKHRLAPIGDVGRMCLTNYLVQSLVWVLLFNGYGLGLFGQVNLFNRALLATLVFVIHVVTSRWWMRHFRFGPAEWLWRSATYRRFQPMKRRGGLAITALLTLALLTLPGFEWVHALPSIQTRSSTTNGTRTCEGVASLSLPQAQITLASEVSPGTPSLFVGGREVSVSGHVGFCRIAATLTPTPKSNIQIEVWVPTMNWNGRFLVRNGDSMNYGGMSAAVRDGYATASTSAGRTGTFDQPESADPEAIADFAYRGVHEMTLKAKAIIAAVHGRAPRFSYWHGCSAAGGQGLMSAHRYPRDYDGIFASAPGSPLSHGYAAWRIWLARAASIDPAVRIPPDALRILHEATLRACDTIDGLEDGLIDDPRRCKFDPLVLLCSTAGTTNCLTAPQVSEAKRFLGPFLSPRTMRTVFPALERGSEPGWAFATGLQSPPPSLVNTFKYALLKDPTWDWREFDVDRDVNRAESSIESHRTNTLDPDVRAFVRRGGKLLLHHGWSDAANAPQSTITYYERVRETVGRSAASSVRLFMAPGEGHCGGASGPGLSNAQAAPGVISALERWVETGKAPELLVAFQGARDRGDRTRPLCPYPQVARYRGSGDVDDARNFQCTKR